MEINNLNYGNPTIEQLFFLEQKTIIDDLFIKLSKQDFPANGSELTKDELNELVDLLGIVRLPENEEFLKRYKAYDRNHIQSIISIFKSKGIDVEKLCLDIKSDIEGLIYKLKFHFQRPRPFQLAFYMKLKLFPYKSHCANTPSFPSLHTCESTVILSVIGNLYPVYYQFCKEMISDIAYSRTYLGFNFSSDNDFAKEVATSILKFPAFTKKYNI